MGYIFVPKTEEGFVKTGLVHIETLPEGASIILANKHIAEKTPTTIRDLMPGTYPIQISLKGYRPWTQNIPVRAGKAIALDKILLLPNELKFKELSKASFKKLIPLEKTRFFLLSRGDRLGDFFIFNWKEETLKALLRPEAREASLEVMKCFTMPESFFILFQLRQGNEIRFLSFETDKEEPEIQDLTDLFSGLNPEEIQWEEGKVRYLFSLNQGNLSRVDLEERMVLPLFLEKIQGYGLFKNKVYAIRASSILRIPFNAKKGSETVVEKAAFIQNLFKNENSYKIKMFSSDLVLFHGKNGELLTNRLPYQFIPSGLLGYEVEFSLKKILIWQKSGLGILDFSRSQTRRGLFERGAEIDWIFDRGDDIRQAFLAYEGSHVLFQDRGKIFLLALNQTYPRFPLELAEVRKDSDFFYSEKSGEIYFLDMTRGNLMAMPVLPETKVQEISRMITDLEKTQRGPVK